MRAKLTSRESLTLYGIVVAVTFGFFVLGLYWGRNGSLFSSSDPPATRNVGPVAGRSMTARLQFPKKTSVTAPRQDVGSRAPEPRIEIRATEPAQVAADPSPAAEKVRDRSATSEVGVRYSIQVGALNTEEEARKVIVRLESRGYTGILDKPSGTDRYYRVRVGQYEDRESALRAEALLKGEGFLTFIKKIEKGSRTN